MKIQSSAASVPTPLSPLRTPAPTPTATGDQVELSGAPDVRPWSNIQAPSTQLESRGDGSLQVNNVRWGFDEVGQASEWSGIFKDAKIDPKHVKNVYLGVKPFNPEILAAHSVLIFEMDEDHPVTNSDGQQDTGLVLSMEARLHQGEKYGIMKTLKGTYGVVYQLGTYTDLIQKTTRREPHQLIRYRLDLDDQQKEQLLRNTMEASVAKRDGQLYNLFTNSCHSVVIDLVNSVAPANQKMQRWLLPHLYNPMAALPPYGDMLFAGHHLLAHESRLLIQPDELLHPGAAKGQTRLGSVVKELSSHSAWTPLCGVTGAAAGAAVGAALNCLPPLLSIPLGAAGGAYLGMGLGETLKRRTHTDYEPSSKYFPG